MPEERCHLCAQLSERLDRLAQIVHLAEANLDVAVKHKREAIEHGQWLDDARRSERRAAKAFEEHRKEHAPNGVSAH